MELNREQIIKALEYCANNDECVGVMCPYYAISCENHMPKDALSLINELTEENEKLTINMNAFGLAAKRLGEENERLRVDNQALRTDIMLKKENDDFKLGLLVKIREDTKADTVRKMQERLKNHLEKPEFPWDSFTVAEEVIDQIAKEMLDEEIQ